MAKPEILNLEPGQPVVYVESLIDKKEVPPCSPGADVTIYFGVFGQIHRLPFSGLPHVTSNKSPETDIIVGAVNNPDKKGTLLITPSVDSHGYLKVEQIGDQVFRCFGDEKLEQQLEVAQIGTRFQRMGRLIKFLT